MELEFIALKMLFYTFTDSGNILRFLFPKKYLETILIFINAKYFLLNKKTLFRLSSRYVAPKLKFTQHHNIYNNWRKMEIFYEKVNDFTFYLH